MKEQAPLIVNVDEVDEVEYQASGCWRSMGKPLTPARGVFRYVETIREIRAGDCISCPAGTGVAHQLANPFDGGAFDRRDGARTWQEEHQIAAP